MKKETILVTGGAGYIGSHAVKRLLQEGYAVTVFDNFFRGFRQPLDILKKYGELEVIEGDLTREEDVRRAFAGRNIGAVMHFAALCLVSESVEKPELYSKNNVIGTHNLLEAMREAGVEKLIFSSTCAVYGNADYLPIDEKHPTRPNSPYGESKLAAERMIEQYGRSHGLRYAILRYFNVCGADSGGEIGDSKKPSELLVQNAVRGALGLEDFKLTCPRVDTPDGTPIRDYINVEDLVDAHVKALTALANGPSIVANLGTGRGFSVREIVEEVRREMGVEFPVGEGSRREGEDTAVFADNAFARTALGWRPEKTLADSIRSLARWSAGHPRGYDR